MSLGTGKFADGSINAKKLQDPVRKGNYFYQAFGEQPSCAVISDGSTAPSNAAANRALFGMGGLYMEYNMLGSGQTIVAPVHVAASGLTLTGDTTTGKGCEYVFGGCLGATNPLAITIPNYAFITLKLKIADVSNQSPVYLGWRKNEAVQADFNDYADFAGLNVKAGALKSETIVGGAATVETDLSQAWADNETHTLTVRVLGDLAVYEFDGAAVSGAPVYQFTTGLVVLPVFGFLNNGTGAAIYGVYAEGGLNKAITTTGNDVL